MTNDVELNPLVIVTLPDALNTTPPPSFCEMKKLAGELRVLIMSALALPHAKPKSTSPTKKPGVRRMMSYNFPLAYFLMLSLMQSAYHLVHLFD